MQVNGYSVPEDLLYTKEHEWARISNPRLVTVGITDYAAKMLTDVVYVALPSKGSEVKQFSTFGTVESIKTVSDLYSPFSGRVVRVNEELDNSPELVNKSPYDRGWMIEIEPTRLEEEKPNLLSADGYASLIKELVKK